MLVGVVGLLNVRMYVFVSDFCFFVYGDSIHICYALWFKM